MSSEIAVRVSGLSKCYHVYDKPRDRLKQALIPRLRRLIPLAGGAAKTYFSPFWALRDASFEVKRGETIGVIGRNGSGKSTLLQLICGTLTPTSGEIAVSGRVAALLELGAGFNPEFTGRENVFMNAALLGLSKRETEDQLDTILGFADIGPFIDQPVKTYSSGMYVRLAFAIAISVTPDILIVDEALSVGDEAFQRKCFSRLESLRAGGCTILFVSHSGSTVVELCDRAVLLDQGDQLMVGPSKQVVSLYHKLIYSPGEKAQKIRDEILAGETPAAAVRATEPASENEAKEPDQAAFDPYLRPQSTLRYEGRGATIIDPKILTKDDQQVNLLVAGESYDYCYRVRFDKPAARVRFGMLIKTISGLELGGAASAPSFIEGIEHAEAGAEFEVRFRFRCLLAPGVYFLNAGVVAGVNDVEEYLDRVIDALMFRVKPNEKSTATGMVDFMVEPRVRRLAN